jgi:tRNA U34 2-thiouridine synthase MnmA/TrmU
MGVSATIEAIDEEDIRVLLGESVFAPAIGQGAVLYERRPEIDGLVCLGGGWIVQTE